MIYVLNKNKIVSCIFSIIFVLFLFVLGTSKEHNEDVELIKVVSNDIIDNSTENYIKYEK